MHRAVLGALLGALLAACSGSTAPAGDPTVSSTTSSSDATTSAGVRADDVTGSSGIVPPADGPRTRTIRWTGMLEAVRSTRVTVPQITGPTFRMTLTRIVPNGSTVREGDVIAEFDPLEQLTQARESAAKHDDLAHQVKQRQADNGANAEKRRLEHEEAEAELAKAKLEVSKAAVLGTIEARQNTLRAAKAEARLDSLRRTHPESERADRAALRILELQRDRQKAAYDRALANLEKLRVRAPLTGMVAHTGFYSNGVMVRPQAGDQLNRNSILLSIFDPGEMLVRVSVPEPDGALLRPALGATVHVDAYPDMALPARFVTASPIAAAASLGGGVKTFMAVFRLDGVDQRLMPDLSAAVVFEARDAPTAAASLPTTAVPGPLALASPRAPAAGAARTGASR